MKLDIEQKIHSNFATVYKNRAIRIMTNKDYTAPYKGFVEITIQDLVLSENSKKKVINSTISIELGVIEARQLAECITCCMVPPLQRYENPEVTRRIFSFKSMTSEDILLIDFYNRNKQIKEISFEIQSEGQKLDVYISKYEAARIAKIISEIIPK